MSERVQTLLIHIVGVAVVALAAWVALQLKGTDDATNGLRVALIGGACGLYGKLGFKPAPSVVNSIIEQMAHKEPQRIARLTSTPPPAASIPPEGFAEVHSPDGKVVGYLPKKTQEPKP